MSRADERENEFLLKLLEKHRTRLKAQFDRYVVSSHGFLFLSRIFIVVAERTNQNRRRHETHYPKTRWGGSLRETLPSLCRSNRSANDRGGGVGDPTERGRGVRSHRQGDVREPEANGEDGRGGRRQGAIELSCHPHRCVCYLRFRRLSLRLTLQCPENMHHFVAEIQSLDIGSVSSFLVRAEGIYDDSLAAYVKLVLRRPFLKILVGGFIDQVLRSMADLVDR